MAETDAERATRLLVQFTADLAALCTRPAYHTAAHVLLTGLLQFTEGLARRAIRLEPAALPILLTQIDAMRAHVQAVGENAAARTPPDVTWH